MSKHKACAMCHNSSLPADMFISTRTGNETKVCQRCRDKAALIQARKAQKARSKITRRLRCSECGGKPTARDNDSGDWSRRTGFLTLFRGRLWCSDCLMLPSEPNHIGPWAAQFSKIEAPQRASNAEFLESNFTPEEHQRWDKNLADLQRRLRER